MNLKDQRNHRLNPYGLLCCVMDVLSNITYASSITKTALAGPKGVINDWRKFKLETEDHDDMPPSRRELLRQMSTPQKPEEFGEKVNRKVSYLVVFPLPCRATPQVSRPRCICTSLLIGLTSSKNPTY